MRDFTIKPPLLASGPITCNNNRDRVPRVRKWGIVVLWNARWKSKVGSWELGAEFRKPTVYNHELGVYSRAGTQTWHVCTHIYMYMCIYAQYVYFLRVICNWVIVQIVREESPDVVSFFLTLMFLRSDERPRRIGRESRSPLLARYARNKNAFIQFILDDSSGVIIGSEPCKFAFS